MAKVTLRIVTKESAAAVKKASTRAAKAKPAAVPEPKKGRGKAAAAAAIPAPPPLLKAIDVVYDQRPDGVYVLTTPGGLEFTTPTFDTRLLRWVVRHEQEVRDAFKLALLIDDQVLYDAVDGGDRWSREEDNDLYAVLASMAASFSSMSK